MTLKVVTIPARRALDVAAERWRGRAAVYHKPKLALGKWVRTAATAVWCFSCNVRVALSGMREHVLSHVRRKR